MLFTILPARHACRAVCRAEPLAMALAALLELLLPLPLAAGAETAETFTSTAAPILQAHCSDCHAGSAAEAGVDLKRLTTQPDFAGNFRTWEKVIEALAEGRMPPADAEQPSARERTELVAQLRAQLARTARRLDGDPGQVQLRRLTSAEYRYVIHDLTGLDLPLDQMLASDAVGGEGFTNVGDVQFVQDSTLERYLEAARHVAAHAVVGTDRLRFFDDPGETGRELAAIERILHIDRTHGFRTAAGEGAEPYGLHLYPDALFAAWRFRHRSQLGLAGSSLGKVAREHGLDVRFLEHIWRVVHESDASFPTSLIVEAWQALPAPSDAASGGDLGRRERNVRTRCDGIARLLRTWQGMLAAASGDEEEAAVLADDTIAVDSQHAFQADIEWPPGASEAVMHLSVTSASHRDASGTLVLWKNPRLRMRTDDMRWREPEPLAEFLTDESRAQLRLGHHPAQAALEVTDFVLGGGEDIAVRFRVPAGTTRAQLFVDVELDRDHGADGVVRCSISDGEVEGETAAETGTTSALLADPASPEMESWTAGVREFARKLPEVSHREPAPSDRDPIPFPFDNTYNQPERNRFHTRIKYQRNDAFLVEHILDDSTRRTLDLAWFDLLTAFDYYGENLQFLIDKYQCDLPARIEDVTDHQIAALPEALRPVVEDLRRTHHEARRALELAAPGHVEDALRLASHAWRRPLTDSEQSRLRTFYRGLRDEAGLDHPAALRGLLTRIFIAPAFLYRIESPAAARTPSPDTPSPDQTEIADVVPLSVVPLSDWELASRLSFFLWSSVPDATLRKLAASGQLHNPDVLQQQVRRMLADAKARRFATEFFGQWFGFYRFDTYRGIDTDRFPEFDERLKTALYKEAITFFEHIVRQDRPVEEILFADYGFLNRTLAEHYRIAAELAPPGQLQRVDDIDQFHRGGLLRLGAVLAVTSAPLRTSAVKRGDWILRRVLGTPVPPPPPDAGSIPADDVLSDGKTVRERLEAHRRETSCVNCHSRIDPLGFALEHFDPLGRWRTEYRDGRPIDAAGVLNTGHKIEGPEGLRNYLATQRAQFHRNLCTKLLGYALGRTELLSDRSLIERMQSTLQSDSVSSGRLSDLVVTLVTSPQFVHRRALSAPRAAASVGER